MMPIRQSLFVCLLIFTAEKMIGQQPALTIADGESWPVLGMPLISNDGNYVMYTYGSWRTKQQLFIRSTTNDWSMVIDNGMNPSFSNNSRYVIGQLREDSLFILHLADGRLEYMPGVVNYKHSCIGSNQWLAVEMNKPQETLQLKNLNNGKVYNLHGVQYYTFRDSEEVLLFTRSAGDNLVEVVFFDLKNGIAKPVWQGKDPGNFVFDDNDRQLLFTSHQQVWYYDLSQERAELIIDDSSACIPAGYRLNTNSVFPGLRFLNDGQRIFISLSKKKSDAGQKEMVKVNVWSYRDAKLQSMQLAENDPENVYAPHVEKNVYTAVYDLAKRKIYFLERENEKVFNYIQGADFSDDHVLVKKTSGDVLNEWNWNREAQTEIYLVSTVDGSRRLLLKGQLPPTIVHSFHLSPAGKYVVYFDPHSKQYHSYSVLTNRSVPITKNIKAAWTTFDRDDWPAASYSPIGVGGFTKNDEAIILYDQYDIFQAEPAGKRPAVNLTNGYGAKNHITFRLAFNNASIHFSGDSVLLNGFNRKSKTDGFYTIPGLNQNPVRLIEEEAIYKGPDESDNVIPFVPLKSRDANIFIVRKMTASQSPNYFVTKDFKNFKPVSSFYPENKVNWLTTELINWTTSSKVELQGILYKPQDFDSTKKYPLIIHYYEKVSEGLNAFLRPGACMGPMNIPFFVSNGYLVFTPDIQFEKGAPGKSAREAIVSGAKYLSRKPWVDEKRMGLQGHSFGGFQTNYVVTHTSMFAAAMSSSGMSDFVSIYGSIIGDGSSRQRQYELYRDRIGGHLWDKQQQYLENSPVLFADRMRTPLLMMHNRKDGDVPFTQAVEFFTALRRLGKKAWMLEYENGAHGVVFKDAEDLTVRMKQFFDHYLKGAPAPIWMTKGIPTKMRGVDDGLRMDEKIKTPGRGLLRGH